MTENTVPEMLIACPACAWMGEPKALVAVRDDADDYDRDYCPACGAYMPLWATRKVEEDA